MAFNVVRYTALAAGLLSSAAVAETAAPHKRANVARKAKVPVADHAKKAHSKAKVPLKATKVVSELGDVLGHGKHKNAAKGSAHKSGHKNAHKSAARKHAEEAAMGARISREEAREESFLEREEALLEKEAHLLEQRRKPKQVVAHKVGAAKASSHVQTHATARRSRKEEPAAEGETTEEDKEKAFAAGTPAASGLLVLLGLMWL